MKNYWRSTGFTAAWHAFRAPHSSKRVSKSLPSKPDTLLNLMRTTVEPIADRPSLRVARVDFQNFQVMGARLDRLLKLLRVEVAQRQVCPAVIRILRQQLLQLLGRIH